MRLVVYVRSNMAHPSNADKIAKDHNVVLRLNIDVCK